jgi:integrase
VAARRRIGLLGAIITYAIDHGMRADNPAHRVRKFAENRRQRRLTEVEYAALSAGLKRAESSVWPPAISCLHFLTLTGWRSGEAISLRWNEVDLVRRTAILTDTKTGRSMRPLSHAACNLLRTLPSSGDAALVFPATRTSAPMSGFKKFARRIMAMAQLPVDVTPHVLRHYVSFLTMSGTCCSSPIFSANTVGP